ncbi:hypothetical protein TH53_18805 [Pedobacter lusitanus]|uniref:Uncharacterized protein n=1 Tax=Pedobacter lusitanus TaxID=1503925 RepID=A0A0D0GEP9_9SPHI|nr:hypothetical protein TH53_18805 [Pedobacter lusitanus]
MNDDFLKLWNAETNKAMIKKGDKKSIFLLDFEKKHNLSVFGRKDFLKSFKQGKIYSEISFSELWVLEINYSGEKNQRIKYLMGICGNACHMTKWTEGVRGWLASEDHKIKTEDFENLYTVLNRNDDKRSYWGGNITEIASLTQFKDGNQISVQVFGALNKMQFDTINGLNFK